MLFCCFFLLFCYCYQICLRSLKISRCKPVRSVCQTNTKYLKTIKKNNRSAQESLKFLKRKRLCLKTIAMFPQALINKKRLNWNVSSPPNIHIQTHSHRIRHPLPFMSQLLNIFMPVAYSNLNLLGTLGSYLFFLAIFSS